MSWNHAEKEADEAKKEQKILQDELQTIRDERARVQAELNNSDYGKKEQELKDLEYRIALLADNSAQWRQIRERIETMGRRGCCH